MKMVLIQRIATFLGLSLMASLTHANMITCPPQHKTDIAYAEKQICKYADLEKLNEQMNIAYIKAQLLTNAPLKLLQNSQDAWDDLIKECRTKHCISQHISHRIDDLEVLTSLNQKFTQHYLRYKNGKLDMQITQIQLQQLDKNRLKIEAIQYSNPNRQDTTHYASLRSYATSDDLSTIRDLETKCTYSLSRQRNILHFESKDKVCKKFDGVYKLYD